MLLTTGQATAATITQSGTGGVLPDLSTVSFDINIGTSGTVLDVTVRFDIAHPQIGDIRISLTNLSAGVTRDIVYREGGDTYNRNYGGLGIYEFNDSYTGGPYSGDIVAAVQTQPGGTNAVVPYGNYYASTVGGAAVDLSAAFGGTEALGTWRLTVQDLRSNNTGTLNSWGLTLATEDAPPPPAVPEPSTYIIFGLGLGGIAAFRRRR